MPGTITLNIPLKSYLSKYLTQKFGKTHQVSRHSWLGKYLIDLLDKRYRKSTVDIKKDSYYKIIIPSYIIKEHGFEISGKKLKHLSEMVEKVFLNDMYSYIQVSIGNNLKFYNEEFESINKQNTLQAISQFLKFYNINEDEASVDTIYRTYYRSKKSDNKKIATTTKAMNV